LAAINNLIGWLDPKVNEFFTLLGNIDFEIVNESLANISTGVSNIVNGLQDIVNVGQTGFTNLVNQLGSMGVNIVNSINAVANNLLPLAGIDSKMGDLTENMETLKDILRDMVSKLTYLSGIRTNTGDIASILGDISDKIPTLEDFLEGLQDILNEVTVSINIGQTEAPECNNIFDPRCWSNIWQNYLGYIASPLPIVPTASRPKRKKRSIL
jgi:hypothetical protein